MSEITIKEKVVQQATQLVIMGQQVNFLLRELYKSKPDHEIFIKNINLAVTVKAAVDTEVKNAKAKESTNP
jgi:hypothetical protein